MVKRWFGFSVRGHANGGKLVQSFWQNVGTKRLGLSTFVLIFQLVSACNTASVLAGSDPVKVGDKIFFKLQTPELGFQVEAPPSIDLQKAGWAIESPPQNSGSDSWAAVPLKSGKLELPPLILKNSQGKEFGRTNPFSVEVVSGIKPNDPKPHQPEELEPPVRLGFPLIWVLSLCSIGVLLIAVGLYFLIRFWKKRRSALKAIPPENRSEDELALSELERLEKENLIEKGHFKSYYFRISEIFKSYLGGRYRFDAPESTTGEMIRYLRENKSMEPSSLSQLVLIFTHLDQVKFTDFIPQTDESKKILGEVRDLIRATRRPQMIMAQASLPKSILEEKLNAPR